MNPRRSASVGALPREKKHFVSRHESVSGVSLDVRCACQYFQCDSLLPERINPVDSRPSSQLGFHNDLSQDEQVMFMETLMSAHDHQYGAQTTAPTEIAPVVDLSFVEMHPELEETAKKRGLVVRSISDANEPDHMIAISRGRQMSVGAVSAGSARRDLDNMSTHSVTSLRRLQSRSPSRKDLFVADINIPSYQRGSSVSASASRRTSTADLSQFTSPHRSATPLVQHSATNLRSATQSSNYADVRPDLTSDYLRAKTPLSTDYMRPSDNKENLAYVPPVSGEILPQHRPIHIETHHMQRSAERTDVTNVISEFERVSSRAPSPVPTTPLISKTEPLPTPSAVLQIADAIALKTTEPATVDTKRFESNIVLTKETEIDIVRKEPEVDIEKLVGEEREKVLQSRMSPKPPPRHHSPTPKRQLSPTRDQTMDTLNLPAITRSHANLKRQHTPERETLTNSKTDTFITQPHIATINDTIPLQEASPESKSTYTSRFKAMFSSQKTDDTKDVSTKRQRSASPTSRREKSPSPNKLMSMFSKNKGNAIEITSGSNAAVAAKSEADIVASQITETFSLKVDEMDQYSCKPKQAATESSSMSQLNTPLHTTYSSREDIGKIKYSSTDISEAFAPVILAKPNIDTFFAGSRNLYSADIDVRSSLAMEGIRQQSTEPSSNFGSNFQIPKGALISMPININASSAKEGFNQSIYRSPSEQKVRSTTPSSNDGRTQSQDLARNRISQDDMSTQRMTKTVSFNFDERKSRLANYETTVLSQQKQEHYDYLERSYFSR